MSEILQNLNSDELEFYSNKSHVSKREILKFLNSGLSFEDSIITEAQESLTSYYNWIKKNIKEEDKKKFNDWDKDHETSYEGKDLTEYQKIIFDKLPNVGKFMVGSYSRMWRALEEAEESLMEFVHHELKYLINPIQ